MVVAEQARDFRGSFSGYERDRLFYNTNGADERLVQSAYVFGLDHDHDGRAAAAVDIDGDGDLDLALLTLRGLRLLENRSASGRFARIQLPAHALGAEVTLRAGGVTRRDFVKITEGFRIQAPRDLHFGLGAAATIDLLEVRWPSGDVESWTALPVDRLLVVRAGESAVEARPLLRWPEDGRPNVVGSPTPTTEAEQLDGGMAPLAGGRPAVINFWAPWCAPCNVELPQLVGLADRYAGDVDFVGVSVELQDLPSVRATLERFGVPYRQFLADETVLARFFGGIDRAALPSTFVFDGQGRLRRLFRGAVTEADLDAVLASFRDEGVSEDHLRLLARTYFDAGNYEAAVDYYRRLVDLEPPGVGQIGLAWDRRRALDRFNLGRARLRSGRAEEAVEDLQAARRSLGDDHAVLVELGIAAAFAGQLQLAGDALGRAVRIDPESARAWFNKARVHRARGEIGAARDGYAQVIRLDPDNAQARQELAALPSGVPRPR